LSQATTKEDDALNSVIMLSYAKPLDTKMSERKVLAGIVRQGEEEIKAE